MALKLEETSWVVIAYLGVAEVVQALCQLVLYIAPEFWRVALLLDVKLASSCLQIVRD